MKVRELRQKSKTELNALLIDLIREQFNLKMQKGTGQLARFSQVKRVRRNIARTQTIMNEMTRANL